VYQNFDTCLLVKDILSRGMDCKLRAKGYSMSPFIKDGDLVTLSPSPYGRLKPPLPKGRVCAIIYDALDSESLFAKSFEQRIKRKE